MQKNKAIGTGVNYIFVMGMLVVIFLQVHWSVALLFAWIAVSLGSIVGTVYRKMNKITQAVKAIEKKHEMLVTTLNEQAKEMHRKLNTCEECEKHGKEGIRFGSFHNRNATNCLLTTCKKL